MKRAFLYIIATLVPLVLLSCSKDDKEEEAPSVDISIEVAPTEITLRAGETANITATVTPASAPNRRVLWISDNTKIAYATDGLVKAVAPGTATITAKTELGGRTATCKVTVLSAIKVKSIAFEDDLLLVDEHRSTYEIPVTVEPSDATNKDLVWKSSNINVAMVADGVLRIISEGTTTITATAKDGSGVSSTCEIVIMKVPDAVDLGLSVKWASYNLGAESPEGFGDYYAWGETETKDSFDTSNYRFSSDFSGPYSKYNTQPSYGPVDNKVVLDGDDDPAYREYKGKWRIPTKEEFDELVNPDNCNWSWTKVNGVSGYRVTGKKAGYTGSSIFLPAAGLRLAKDHLYENEWGLYWTSGLDQEYPCNAYCVDFDASSYLCEPGNRFVGYSIRPVTK